MAGMGEARRQVRLEGSLVRWAAAVFLAAVVTFVVLTVLGAVGIYEFVVVFALALACFWFLVVRPARNQD
jgi:hypothetical protein